MGFKVLRFVYIYDIRTTRLQFIKAYIPYFSLQLLSTLKMQQFYSTRKWPKAFYYLDAKTS